MKTVSAWIKTGITALVLISTGCASDSSTQVGVGGSTQFSDVIAVSGNLNGTVGQELGGSNSGVVFTMKGAAASTPYYWTVVGDPPSGVLKYPLGDTIPSTIPSPTFSLKGIPSACGQYPLTFTVHTFPGHQTVVAALPLTVTVGGGCAPPSITTTSIDLIRDAKTSRQLGLTGGTPPYTWSVTGLNAIPGMTFDSTTGTLSGTPTATVTTTLAVQVTDNAGRSTSQPVSVTVRQYRLEDFTGTWSGLLTQGYFQQPNNSFIDVSGRRLSLLLGNPTSVIDPVTQTPYLTDPITHGTLGDIVLSPVPTGLSLQPSAAGYRGLFNGQIPDLKWHFTCDPDPNTEATLICVGHHYVGAAYDAQVTLTRVSVVQQDSTPPAVLFSSPQNGEQTATTFPLTVTFSEPMSSSGTVALTQGSAMVGPVTFTSLTTAIVPLSGLNSNTPYSLTLNPTGQAKFLDLAGNPLPTTTISFTTGVLATAKITVQKTGDGAGSVAFNPSGIICDALQTSCSADLSVGTPLTLIATASAGSEFIEWSGGACSGKGNCQVTLNADTTVTANFAQIPLYDLTVDIPSAGGTISSSPSSLVCALPTSCSGQFLRDTVVTLSVEQPEPGYAFTGWSGAGCSGTGTCVVTMSAAKTVTANFTLQSNALSVTKNGSGTGTVASSPTGISCGATCSMNVDYGSIVTLTATPSSDSTFTSWSGGGCSGNGDCAVTVESATGVTATFTLKSYSLSVTKNGSGAGTVSSNPSGISLCSSSCSATFTHGTVVTLTANAAADSTFTGWSGACSGTADCAVTMDNAKSVFATFAIRTYTLTINKTGSGSGSVSSNPTGLTCGSTSCSGTFSHGTTITLTATANSGSVFSGWTGAGCSGTGDCQILNITSNTSVSAAFIPQPTFQLTVGTTGSGIGTVSSDPSGISCPGTCLGNFPQSSLVTLTATPAAGSTFSGWSAASCPGTGTCSVTMDGDKSVTATFTIQTYALTVGKLGAGAGTVASSPIGITCGTTCSFNFNYGTQVTLTAAPTAGSSFVGWSGNGVTCPGTGTCTVTVTAATTVNATFTTVSYTLSVATNGGLGTGVVTSNPAGINCGSTCSFSFAEGTSVTLTAAAAPGSTFAGWSDSSCLGTGTCVVRMDAPKSVTATFTAQGFSLSITRDGSGTGSVTSDPTGISCGPTCAADFANNSVVTLTAVPDGGSVFSGWSGAGCSGTGTCSVTMVSAQSVTATFTAQSGVIAYGQSWFYRLRQQTTPAYKVYHAITFTGSSPNGGPLTFRITKFPQHQDPQFSINMVAGGTYQFVDPITGAFTQAVADASTTINKTVGDPNYGVVSGAPYIIWTPTICHDYFKEDTIEFVAIDSLGNVSPPATIHMVTNPNVQCTHAF